jgi:glutamyl-Q tRNA(Asp) synthetase
LLAAVASYLEARAQRGRWLLRIEDIDPPREQPGATGLIIDALGRYGFEWDGPVLYQSASLDAHLEAIAALGSAGLTYRCGCSRSDLADAPRGPVGIIYPGTCRDKPTAREGAIRVRTDNAPIEFEDRLQGRQSQRLESEAGDFIIRRRDGLIAYHLAVVVDDHLQGVTEVVRGVDLLDSTPRQIWLQRLLGYPQPAYRHLPVAVDASGEKLSKSSGAVPLSTDEVGDTLLAALRTLRQNPPSELASAPVSAIWSWALEHWDGAALRGVRQVSAGPGS